MNALKKMVVSLLTSSLVGGVIATLTRNRISFNGVVVRTDDHQISKYIKACLFWGLYEKQEAQFIQKYLPNDLPVIELGASIGVISCVTARKIFPQKTYAVEASPYLIPIIEKNLGLNQLDNCSVLNLALGRGQFVFFTPGDNNTVGTISDTKQGNSISVPCSSLSGIARLANVQKFNLVCDVEGSEVDFLFEDTAALAGCQWMIIELHDTNVRGNFVRVAKLKERISELGYTLVDSHGPVVVARRTDRLS